ncbi:MAG: InlB B-repeat-containing protein, partial [Clostridia bacterium]|nr:InlB B-repeat-containing protein [Clostridia bacterium]
MKKMKKLISLALALTMVLSLCPTILSTNASADWTNGMWSGPDAAATGVSAVVSYSTDVLRVASQRYSPISGNKIVAATPSGSPEVANNTAAAYAGEQIVIPKVYLELGAEADSTPTIQFTSMNSQTCSITPTFEGVTGTTYEWTIPYDGASATATAGDTLKITFTYSVGGVQYTAYGALNVQLVQGGIGQDIYRGKSSNSTGGSTKNRFEAAIRVLGKGLYAENNGSSQYGAFTGTDSAHSTFNFNAGDTDYDSVGDNLQYFHVTGNTVTQNCYKAGNYTNGKTVYNMGYVDDGNRPHATIYVDRSQYTAVGQSGVDLRYEIVCTGYDSSDQYSTYLTVNRSYLAGPNTSNPISGNDTEGSSGIYTSPYITQPNYGPTDGTTYNCNGKAVGAYMVQRFGGNLTTLGNSTGSSAYNFAWYPQLRGSNPDETKCTTSMAFHIYMVDKGALRATVAAIQSGVGLTAAGLSEFGANPQSNSFNSTSYNTYLTAYQNALKVLADGKAKNQTIINDANDDLKDAYNHLSRVTGKVYAHCILQGTQISAYNNWSTDLYVQAGGTTAALTSPSKDVGSEISFTAPTIDGYTLQSDATQTITLTDQATIIVYYTLAMETYTFDPVVVDAGDPKTKDFQNQSTFYPLQDAPQFTYNHYHVEGWYKNYNATTGAYSNKQTSVLVDTHPFTLYAKWEPNPLVVHYDLAGLGTMTDSYYALGATINQPADPVIQGQAFLGWFTDASYVTPFTWGEQVWYSDVGASTTSPYDSESITAYALFESYNNKIVFRTNGGMAVEPLDVEGLSAGAAITLPTPVRTGYTFDGWYANENLTGTSYPAGATTLPASHVGGGILYAKWTPNPVTLTYNIGYNPNANNSAVDSIHNPDNITGLTGSPIRDAYTAQGLPLPADPVKFGYVFGGWYIGSNVRIINDMATYNNAVSSGAITLVDPATDNFPASAASSLALSAVWVRTTTAAFIELDAYKEMYGELVPVADASVTPGDIITVQMKSTTNFYTASTVFVYMYDNTMFELIGSGKNAFTLNADNSYISAITGTNGTDYSGYTASPSRSECPSGYNWIQVSIDPDVLGGVSTGGQMNDGTWMVQFKLRVKSTATPGSSGIVYMDNAWTRDPDNNNGTMFYGWLDSASTTVWNSHNNYVTPLLQLATDTVTLSTEPAPQSAITADPHGGTWPDNSTGTKRFPGGTGTADAGEQIEGYAEPTRRGYELTEWQKYTPVNTPYNQAEETGTYDSSDLWISGYYGSAAQSGNIYRAIWTPVEYPVTWDANGGAFGNETTLVDNFGYDVSYSGPSTLPTKQGYVVTGWSLTAGGAAVTFPQQMSDTPITYYAIWGPASDTPFTVRVIYVNNATGNMVTSETAGGTYVGTTGATAHFVPDASAYTNTASDVYFSYSQLPTVLNGRYVFDATDSYNTLDCTIAADGSGVIIVFYRGALYTGTFNANGGTYSGYSVADGRDAYGAGFVYEDSSTYVLYREYQTSFADENDATKPAIPPVEPVREGYKFLGWSTSPTASTPGNILIATSNRTYYAVWQGKTIRNTFNANTGTFGDNATTATADSIFGSAIVEPNTPSKPSYNFLGWARSQSATAPETLGTESVINEEIETGVYRGETFYAVWQLTSQP